VTAGIPGIGLGGLFFVISALLMLVFEVVLTLQGRSSLERWRVVGYQSGLAAGIVLVTVGFLWLLELMVFGDVFVREPTGSGTTAAGSGEQALISAAQLLPVSAAPILVTLVLLLAVLCFAEVLGCIARRPAKTSKMAGKKSG
jgi:hypothetical protein